MIDGPPQRDCYTIGIRVGSSLTPQIVSATNAACNISSSVTVFGTIIGSSRLAAAVAPVVRLYNLLKRGDTAVLKLVTVLTATDFCQQ